MAAVDAALADLLPIGQPGADVLDAQITQVSAHYGDCPYTPFAVQNGGSARVIKSPSRR